MLEKVFVHRAHYIMSTLQTTEEILLDVNICSSYQICFMMIRVYDCLNMLNIDDDASNKTV